MKLLTFLPGLACFSMLTVHAQKTVLSYPFQFEKSFLAKGQYDCYFLDNPARFRVCPDLKGQQESRIYLFEPEFQGRQ